MSESSLRSALLRRNFNFQFQLSNSDIVLFILTKGTFRALTGIQHHMSSLQWETTEPSGHKIQEFKCFLVYFELWCTTYFSWNPDNDSSLTNIACIYTCIRPIVKKNAYWCQVNQAHTPHVPCNLDFVCSKGIFFFFVDDMFTCALLSTHHSSLLFLLCNYCTSGCTEGCQQMLTWDWLHAFIDATQPLYHCCI